MHVHLLPGAETPHRRAIGSDAEGVAIPMEPELSESARSRRAGILLTAGAVGYMAAFTIVARVEPDALMAAAFGAIPFALGLGYFLDSTLIRRDAHVS